MEKSIQYMQALQAKGVTYSMTSRNGPNSYDCSSAVYNSLKYAGIFTPTQWVGNTDSLYGDLERAGWTKLGANSKGNYDTQRGDIFIWGKRGNSSGAFGHTGIFTSADNVIHCSAGYNGVHVDNYDQLRAWNSYPEQTFYRYTGSSQPSQGDTDQNLDVGSYIKFDKTYTVNDVQLIGGIWQVRTNELCREGFTWDDNGIPAEPLVEVDAEGYRTSDQDLNVGSLYKIPGKFTVLDIGQYGRYWLALIKSNGLKFWVDVETATEILASDAGTPQPASRPAPVPTPTPTPEPEKPTETAPVAPETPKEDETDNQPTQPETPQEEPDNSSEKPDSPEDTTTNDVTKPKEETMAFSQDQASEIKSNTQEVLDANTEFTPIISDKVKTIAYFVTDTSAILSSLVLTVLAILGQVDGVVAVTLSTAIATALLGVKQTFRLSSKKQ